MPSNIFKCRLRGKTILGQGVVIEKEFNTLTLPEELPFMYILYIMSFIQTGLAFHGSNMCEFQLSQFSLNNTSPPTWWLTFQLPWCVN